MRLFFLILVGLFSVHGIANEFITLSGKVINDLKHPVANAEVKINGNKTTTNAQGEYRIKLSKDSAFQLTINKTQHYPAIRTFNSAEVEHMNNHIAAISLLKKKPGRVMMAFGGDVMMGRRYYRPYFNDPVLIHPDSKLSDSKSLVAAIKPYMSIADYAMVNLETQITATKPTQRAPKSVTFFSEPETLDALSWAGIDYVTLGNNHTYDYLDEGLVSTLQHLNNSNLAFSGAGLTEKEALKAHQQDLNGTPFSFLGYVGWEGSSTPKQTANEHHGGAAFGSMKNMVTSVREEVKNNRLPIVQYHGSQEYADEPTGVTEQRLKASLDAGAGLAIAHHPHVAQGIELYNNKLIAYSMGNFIFDQNFNSTQYSFILYVWLDDGQFYRAEVVPIYVKGYQPTPAVGQQRNTVMKRISSLSLERNTFIANEAGHGVIQLSAKPTLESQTVELALTDKTARLYPLPWHSSIDNVHLPQDHLKYRLGSDLVNGGDFESFDLFASPERGIMYNRETTQLNNFGQNSAKSLGLKLDANESQWFGMQSFKRVYRASNPMTIKAQLQLDKAAKINLYWQGRKKRQKLFDAFKNSPKHLIESISLPASDKWQSIEVDFNSPRIGYKSYRVIIEIINEHNQAITVNLDDFSLIEWHTAFSHQKQPLNLNDITRRASFIGLNEATNSPITLDISHQ